VVNEQTLGTPRLDRRRHTSSVFMAGKTLCRLQDRTPHSCTDAKVALTSLEDCQQATGQRMLRVQLGTQALSARLPPTRTR
jgi:hypothetical protein